MPSPPGKTKAPITPLRFDDVPSWLAGCAAVLASRGARGALVQLAALLGVTDGHTRNLITGARTLNAQWADRICAALSLSQEEVEHVHRIRLNSPPAGPAQPSPQGDDDAPEAPAAPLPLGALRTVELILAAHPAPLSHSALQSLLWPPVNRRTLRALRGLAQPPDARSLARPFTPHQPEEQAWLDYALSGASLALDSAEPRLRLVRTTTFSLADHERPALQTLAARAIRDLCALGAREAPGPRRVMQLLLCLTPLTLPWEGAPAGAGPTLFDERTVNPEGAQPSPGLLAPTEAPTLAGFDHPIAFVRAYLEWRKTQPRAESWTQSALAKRAGLSPSHVANILENARRLTLNAGMRLGKGLLLKGDDVALWTLLVRRASSRSVVERASITQTLARMEPFRRARTTGEVAGVALTHLPCLALDALLSAPGAPREAAALAELLSPSLAPEAVAQSLRWLEDAGLLARGPGGALTPQPLPYLRIGGDVGRDLRVALHREALAWTARHQEAPRAAWGLGLVVIPEAALDQAMAVLARWQAGLRALWARSEQRGRAGPRRLYLATGAVSAASAPLPD